MAVDIEPLLNKLAELAPRFGRARVDLEAIVSRGRAQDYRGVMQNARLVLEVLLRSLVTDELKQTPGKAMLEELVSRFRQQANAGIVPAKILAHMGTVQAWGNLSAHDHAGSLDESGVHVGKDEVVASLNSVVAILGWYAEKKGLATPASAPTPADEGLEPTQRSEPTGLGRVIGGRYRLDSRLAAGGMGEVYQATHIELGRKLALKLMRPSLSAEASFVERFRREAMTASRLGHPHIVDIIDSGRSDDGQFYFVMEFLDGKTLSAVIDQGPVGLPLALELVTQIAQALDVAHRAGVVHRDLKPDNVIVLDRSGGPFVKLVDFGIAKVVAATDQKLTSHGLIMGTPQYMAPEQAAGLAVDARADVYALGLILFELLTGHPPLIGETPALIMSAHISTVAPPLPAAFPASLRTLVSRALAKSPAERPQSMAEVLSALATVPREVVKPWSRPVKSLLGAGLVVSLGVAGWAVWPREAPVLQRPDPAVAAPLVLQPPTPSTPLPEAPAVLSAQAPPQPASATLDAGSAPLRRRTTRQPSPPVTQPQKPAAPALLPAEGL
ncbi:MAG: protein kinase [Archangium sp.]|nr:protein kinase [Archangium sp.]MDP3571806.1 protein kinase [Archangium sp.]